MATPFYWGLDPRPVSPRCTAQLAAAQPLLPPHLLQLTTSLPPPHAPPQPPPLSASQAGRESGLPWSRLWLEAALAGGPPQSTDPASFPAGGCCLLHACSLEQHSHFLPGPLGGHSVLTVWPRGLASGFSWRWTSPLPRAGRFCFWCKVRGRLFLQGTWRPSWATKGLPSALCLRK